MMAWKISIGGLKEMTLTTSPSRNTGTSTVTISRCFTAPTNRLEYCGLLVANTFSTMSRLLRKGRLAVSVRYRGEHLTAVAVGHQHHAVLAILIEKARGDAAEAVKIVVAQRVGQRHHLQPAGHPLHLGVEHEADTAHGFEHALRRVPAVLLVVVKDEADREDDQRQRGSRDQQDETHWQ